MNCTEPVPAGSWLSPIRPAFTSNQAAAVAAGLAVIALPSRFQP